MSEPTKAASRAAKEICGQQMFFHDEVPSIIDRETGLPELIAALKDTLAIVRVQNGNMRRDINPIIANAEDALRKAGEL